MCSVAIACKRRILSRFRSIRTTQSCDSVLLRRTRSSSLGKPGCPANTPERARAFCLRRVEGGHNVSPDAYPHDSAQQAISFYELAVLGAIEGVWADYWEVFPRPWRSCRLTFIDYVNIAVKLQTSAEVLSVSNTNVFLPKLKVLTEYGLWTTSRVISSHLECAMAL